jgi:tetratricopeptide (TPR) repeat protein
LDLALFPAKPNTFSEEAALTVTGAPTSVLDALVDCGLVETVKSNRYSLHQTINDYAALYGSDVNAIDRMLDYFVRFAEAHTEHLEILELEFNNIQAALAIANQTNRYKPVIALVSALYSFLETRGLFIMCEQQLSKVYQIGEVLGNQEERAFILHWLGSFAVKRGRFKEALDYLQHSILLAQASKAQVLEEQNQFNLYGVRAGLIAEQKTQNPASSAKDLQSARQFTLYGVHPGLADELEFQGPDRQNVFTLYGAHSTSLARAARVRALEGHNLYDLGITRMYMGYFIEGCAHLQASLQIYRQLKMRQEEGLALNALGYAYQELCDYQKSNEYLAQALSVCQESTNPRGAGLTHQNLSILYLPMGDFQRALEHSEKCLAVYAKVGDQRGRGWQLYHMGRIQRKLGNYEQARACFEQARQILSELGDRMGLGFAIHNLGLLAADLGEDSAAQYQIEKSLEIFQQLECAGASQANYSLGTLYRRHGDYAGAIPYFERTLQYRREHGYRRGIAAALANLALARYQLGEGPTCLAEGYQALQIIEEVGARPNQARILTFLGQIQLGLGQLDQATESCWRALSLYRELGHGSLALEPLAGLAQICWLEGDLTQANLQVEEILGYLETRCASERQEYVLAGIDDPIQVYLACYHVLLACQDSRASDILDTAAQLLKQRAAQIEDEKQRGLFLENVPSHREIWEISRSW